ncbi:MAG: IS701 family transposase [Candidatus Promineifilaceae bacterium]|nr:IS701 family transposase [Candidatus Promineifilaceae bacterium]
MSVKFENEKEKTSRLSQWGLHEDAINKLGARLQQYHQRYRHWLKTKTRDTSEYGYHYLSGLLRMESKRHLSGIARVAGIPEQNLQQFITDSSWSGEDLIAVLQQDIGSLPPYQQGSVLIADESAEAKAGEESAGSSRQHNGRLGKVEMSQVGVFLALAKDGQRTWIDGELYLAEKWFTQAYEQRRKKLKIPENRIFQTKLELVLVMVKRVLENGVSFDAFDCDTLYGRSGWLRDELHQLDVQYYADIPCNTTLYLEKPHVVKEQKRKHCQVTIIGDSTTAEGLLDKLSFTEITIRPHERGYLTAQFARQLVWTVRQDGTCCQEWLLLRKDKNKVSYSLSNAAPDVDLWTMARHKSHRYFIERANQDAKSELGWDEFQAQKYPAWVHHLALTIMASAFITETLLDWAEQYPRDPALLTEYETDVLPDLSIVNVRTLLRAALPLPQLSSREAAELVIKHLDNRTRSRKSRLRKARGP